MRQADESGHGAARASSPAPVPGTAQTDRDGSGFRLRGHAVTRTETFVDAAFAFSLTLLVIFHDDLPQTAGELRGALLRVPAFVLSFAMLAMFWAAHNRWSRRFGLDDGYARLLSLAFVLVVLVYVYPLRMVMSSFLWLLSGGALPSELGFDPARQMLDLQTTFIVYSLGFGLLAWLVWLLNRHALHTLGGALDEEERYQTRSELGSHAIMGSTAAVSLLTSVIVLGAGMKGWFAGGLPMWIYATLSLSMPLFWTRREARRPSRREAVAHGDGPAHAPPRPNAAAQPHTGLEPKTADGRASGDSA